MPTPSWCGFFGGGGLLIDDMGNDRHIGSRYSIASSAHSALGILINNKGNDSYQTLYGSSMGIAWDNSNSFFLDESGNDVYDCLDRNFCLAQADHNSFSLFNDKSGKDIYNVNVIKPPATNSYNDGKSFSIHIDEGGGNFVIPLNTFKSCPNISSINILSGNLLRKEIHEDAFTDATELTYLRIYSYKRVTGEVPKLNSCTKLTQVNLHYNNMTGSIPNFASSPNIQYIYFHENSFSGTIPKYQNLSSLYIKISKRKETVINNLLNPTSNNCLCVFLN